DALPIYQCFNAKGQTNVLPHNFLCLFAYINYNGNLAGFIILDNHISRFDRRITSQSSHGDPNVAQGNNRSIVHTVADKSNTFSTGFDLIYFIYLSFWQQVSTCARKAQGLGNMLYHGTLIAT